MTLSRSYLGDGHGSVSRKHRHGWDCFKTSGGMSNAMDELAGSLTERIERVYGTAYATGYKNGTADSKTAAVDALLPYARHQDDCKFTGHPSTFGLCNCGFDGVLTELKGK